MIAYPAILFPPGDTAVLSTVFIGTSILWLIATVFFYYQAYGIKIEVKPAEGGRPFSESEWGIVIFATVSTLLAIEGLTLYQRPPEDLGSIMVILAISWLYGTFIFLFLIVFFFFNLH